MIRCPDHVTLCYYVYHSAPLTDSAVSIILTVQHQIALRDQARTCLLAHKDLLYYSKMAARCALGLWTGSKLDVAEDINKCTCHWG